jgi:hypothetical protein
LLSTKESKPWAKLSLIGDFQDRESIEVVIGDCQERYRRILRGSGALLRKMRTTSEPKPDARQKTGTLSFETSAANHRSAERFHAMNIHWFIHIPSCCIQ